MPFDPTRAAIRFGLGLSPRHAPPADPSAMLASLRGPDRDALAFPIAPFADMRPSLADFVHTTRRLNAALGTAAENAEREALDAMRLWARDLQRANLLRTVARGIVTPDGLRERLVAFWADHFTVRSRNSHQHHAVAPFVEEAIRPHVAGRFADMLRSVATHPMMLLYLQQAVSHGPNSRLGIRRNRGINENLAREMLELHTIGVDAEYSQGDVRQLAELLTGLTYHPLTGFRFDPRMAEPGSETVLDVTYARAATLDNVHTALDDLAHHPATAQHIALKLAVHFVSDRPDADLVTAMAQAFTFNGGDLMAVISAMLDHPAAWDPLLQKVKRPLEYITASLRALDAEPDTLLGLDDRGFRRVIQGPLRIMGQPWERPVGPDGWPERDDEWIIPQTMAARITWAMQAPARIVDPLPDPRIFVRTAIGPNPPEDVAFAARAAENRPVGIGVVLASAAFQRR